MAKAPPAGKSKQGPIARGRAFLQEVKVELSKVTWPTRADLKSSTQVVLLMLVIMAVIIWVFDMAFQHSMVWMLEKFG